MYLCETATMVLSGNKFLKHHCRVCKRAFCCVPCRLKHEEVQHPVEIKCDVCMHGYVWFSKIPENSLDHLQAAHFPMRCISCQKRYDTVDAVDAKNGRCSIVVSKIRDQFCSPPILLEPNKMNTNTSTPMQRDDKTVIEFFPDNITPLENDKKVMKYDTNIPNKTPCLAQPSNNEETKRTELMGKRRVTFGEINTTRDSKCDSEEMADRSDSYNTATNLKTLNLTDIVAVDNVNNALRDKKRRSSSINETLWISAVTNFLPEETIHNESDIDESVQEYLVDTRDTSTFLNDEESLSSVAGESKSVWVSMQQLMRKAVSSFVVPTAAKPSAGPLSDVAKKRRHFSEADTEEGRFKRMKFTDVKCRPPIRIGRLIRRVDKSTQTE